MKINGKPYQAIWYDNDKDAVFVINQIHLPFKFELLELKTIEDAYLAIKDMVVRGAPLIGVTAAYGMYLGLNNIKEELWEQSLDEMAAYLKSSRPTAVNLELVVDMLLRELKLVKHSRNILLRALFLAEQAEQQELESCSRIGDFGLELIEEISLMKKGETVNILTHCNAGWLACVDWGTATAPIYKAKLKGIDVHVWVDETRPRNQGARLTAFEMENEGVPYTVIPDNTGGHLMQHGLVDLVIVGSDRTTRDGDVANKIGTYLKALAAADNDIPFYVALPSTSIDFTMKDGVKNIPIEQRSANEVTHMDCLIDNKVKNAQLMPENTPVANYGFDVTPARLVSGLITERGFCAANEEAIINLFPEKK